MRTSKQRFAEWGENEASDFMANPGDEIRARNVRTQQGEIDTAAMSEDVTILVEGRALPSDRIPRPEETITRRRQTHRLAAVEDCAERQGIDHWPIDVMSVEGPPGSKLPVTHFENGSGYFINPRKRNTV